MEKATLAGGCFWCYEPIFQKLNGVSNIKVGYTGGSIENPTYEEVCTGETGHAEAFEFDFDPEIIKFSEILEVFFEVHDPTQLNRQGADIGTQYRSEIFYHNEVQRKTALDYIEKINTEKFDGKVVTKVSPVSKFYVAEDYHQNYYENNKFQPYCLFNIRPKLEKFEKKFGG